MKRRIKNFLVILAACIMPGGAMALVAVFVAPYFRKAITALRSKKEKAPWRAITGA